MDRVIKSAVVITLVFIMLFSMIPTPFVGADECSPCSHENQEDTDEDQEGEDQEDIENSENPPCPCNFQENILTSEENKAVEIALTAIEEYSSTGEDCPEINENCYMVRVKGETAVVVFLLKNLPQIIDDDLDDNPIGIAVSVDMFENSTTIWSVYISPFKIRFVSEYGSVMMIYGPQTEEWSITIEPVGSDSAAYEILADMASALNFWCEFICGVGCALACGAGAAACCVLLPWACAACALGCAVGCNELCEAICEGEEPPPPPPLTPQIISAPSEVHLGETFSVNWIVTNASEQSRQNVSVLSYVYLDSLVYNVGGYDSNLEYIDLGPGETRELTQSIEIRTNLSQSDDTLLRVWAEHDGYDYDDIQSIRVLPKAEFSLDNLYTVSLDLAVTLESGSKLVLKFYDYYDTCEAEKVVWSGITPVHLMDYSWTVPHPQGLPVKKVRLDLTTDDTTNVIWTIASFVVQKVTLEARFMDIPFYWAGADPAGKLDLETEFMEIPFYWAGAPDDPISGPGGTTIEVLQGDNFLIRHTLEWNEPENGAYTVTLAWDSYDNHENENFTFLGAEAYFDLDNDNLPDPGLDPILAVVTLDSAPSPDYPGSTRYLLSVKCPAENKDPRNGQFNVDITLRAAGAGGIPHIPGNHEIIFQFGGIAIIESTLQFWNRDPITIKVFAPALIYPSDDTNSYERFPDSNYGSSTSIWVSPYDSRKNRGFLKFDLSGLPSGAWVTGAKLHLYCWNKQYDDFDAAAYEVANDNWSENTLTWNNQPSYGGRLYTVRITGVGWYTWEVRSFIDRELQGDEVASLCIKGAVEPHGGRARFDSKEWDNSDMHPYLEITYTSPSGEWTEKADTPDVGGYGEAVVGTGSYIYVAKTLYATSTPQFWRYDPTANSWANMSITGLPTGAFRSGTALAWDNSDYIYALAGARYSDSNRRLFFRYSISGDNWTQMADTPSPQGAGDAITWSAHDGYVYALIGSSVHGTTFARYNSASDNWEVRASPPAGVEDGASLVWTGGSHLYALSGEYLETTPVQDFWRYDIVSDSWTTMTPIPENGGVGDGGSLLWVGNWLPAHADYIYALGGGDCWENPGDGFYRYIISADTWERLTSIPYPIGYYVGNRLGFADEHIYYWQGNPSEFYGGGKKFYVFEFPEP